VVFAIYGEIRKNSGYMVIFGKNLTKATKIAIFDELITNL